MIFGNADICWHGQLQLRHTRAVIVVQRVRVRWNASSRGSVHANERSALPHVFALPVQQLRDDVVVHEVLMDQASSYSPHITVASGAAVARAAGLWLDIGGSGVTVRKLPGWQAYPIVRHRQRIFTLALGQTGRHRSNYRFTGCACSPEWYYEQWTIHVANIDAAAATGFTERAPDFDADDRVHLYGGR